MTPGLQRLHERLTRAIGADAVARLVDPILSDIALERRLAVRQRRVWRSRWVVIAGAVSLVTAVAIYGWVNFWSFQHWPAENRRACARTLRYFAAVTTVAMAVLILQVWPRGRHSAPPLALMMYLAPQATYVAIPFGLLLSVLYGLRGTVLAFRSSAAVLILAAVCSLASFTMLAWVIPESNQRFRVALSGDTSIARGLNELTLGELHTRIAAERRLGREPRAVATGYYARWALGAAPAVMATWALIVIACGIGRWWVTTLTAVATWVGFVALTMLGRAAAVNGVVSPSVGAWLPNLAFVIATLLLARTLRTPNRELRTLKRT